MQRSFITEWWRGDSSFYGLPLSTHCKFRIIIEDILESYRYLGFGVAEKKVYDEACETFNRFGPDGKKSYYGYYSSNLEGSIPAYEEEDPEGHVPGKEYFLEFWPDEKVCIYSKDRKVNLRGSVEVDDYYLFVEMGNGSGVTVERLF